MKKNVVYVITIAIIIFLVVLCITTNHTKYSHSDIVALINKGIENMDNMNNISFDKETQNGTVKYYFKGDKRKMITPNNSIAITLGDGKTYIINKNNRTMFVTSSTTIIGSGFQYDALSITDLNEDVRYKDLFRYEFEYIRDEKIENKDCIFVKERVFYIDTQEYVDRRYNSENEVPVYWIEKSTGIVVGTALMEEGKDTTAPQTIIKNIKLGEVTDNVFNDMLEIPNDYMVLEETSDGKVERVK